MSPWSQYGLSNSTALYILLMSAVSYMMFFHNHRRRSGVGPTRRVSFRDIPEDDFADASNTACIFVVLLHSMHWKILGCFPRSSRGTSSFTKIFLHHNIEVLDCSSDRNLHIACNLNSPIGLASGFISMGSTNCHHGLLQNGPQQCALRERVLCTFETRQSPRNGEYHLQKCVNLQIHLLCR